MPGCPFFSLFSSEQTSNCHICRVDMLCEFRSCSVLNNISTVSQSLLNKTAPGRTALEIYSLPFFSLYFETIGVYEVYSSACQPQTKETVEWESRHHAYCDANIMISFHGALLLRAWILSVRSPGFSGRKLNTLRQITRTYLDSDRSISCLSVSPEDISRCPMMTSVKYNVAFLEHFSWQSKLK